MALIGRKSYVHTPSKKPFIGLTMHELLEERVRKHPDREMFVFCSDNERLTYSEYRNKVIDLAAGFLLKLGLRRGDSIAVMGANHMEWPLITSAARAIGVPFVGLQVGHTLETLKKKMQIVNCKALFITRSPETLYPLACEIIPELSESSPGDLDSEDLPNLKMVIASGSNQKSGTIHFDKISIAGNEDKVADAAKCVTIDDISHVTMTSGTTGTPKLAPFTHFQALNGVLFDQDHFDENQENRFVCAGNMAYIVGTQMCQISPLLFGSTSVIPSPTYTFEKFIQAIEAERGTFFMLFVNGIVELLYNPICDNYDLSSLTSGFTGGSPIPVAVVTKIYEKYGFRLLNVYGSTETNSVTSTTVRDNSEFWDTSGRPLPNIEIQILDKGGIPVEVGTVGEVWIRGPIAVKGYYKDITKTKEIITKDGWVKMGDIGKVNDHGYLKVIGRSKDTIIRSGYNIYPSEVEGVLLTHPAVSNAQLVAIPDYRIGEDACACVTLNEGFTVIEDDMRRFCIGKISEFIQPSYFLVFDTFPFGATGKVDRNKLKKMALSRINLPDKPYFDN